jgi:ribonuclease HI
MKKRVVYTDGSCYPTNGGPGGYAAVVLDQYGVELDVVVVGSAPSATNNSMELAAIQEAIAVYLPDSAYLEIHSDSAYCVNSIGSWEKGSPRAPAGWVCKWVANGWKSTTGDVKNQDLLQKIVRDVKQHVRVDLLHVKGHNGTPGNELADVLAGVAKDSQISPRVFRGSDIVELLGSNNLAEIDLSAYQQDIRRRTRKSKKQKRKYNAR